jgi:hypothetical protein
MRSLKATRDGAKVHKGISFYLEAVIVVIIRDLIVVGCSSMGVASRMRFSFRKTLIASR